MNEIRKVPVWVWVAVGIVVIGVVYLRLRAGSASTTTGSTSGSAAQPLTGGSASGTDTSSLGVIASQLQSLNQQVAQGLPAAPPAIVPFNGQNHWFSTDASGNLIHFWQDLSGGIPSGTVYSETIASGLVPGEPINANAGNGGQLLSVSALLPNGSQLIASQNPGGNKYALGAGSNWATNVLPAVGSGTAA